MIVLTLNRWWKKKISPAMFFIPLSWLYFFIIQVRKFFFHIHVLKTFSFKVPIIVVGNITVGGTGKTPVVIALTQYLQSIGKRVAIVSRGYKSKNNSKPYELKISDTAKEVGDEPCLIKKRLPDIPIVICKQRVRACEYLLSKYKLDLIISDDGLQHLKMARNYELALLDPQVGLANGRLLPAGPLREPKSRLKTVDKLFFPKKIPINLISLGDHNTKLPLNTFTGKEVIAASGIQDPARFFKLLEQLGYNIKQRHIVPDHQYLKLDNIIDPSTPIIMTEKDAVKFNSSKFVEKKYNNIWYLQVSVTIPDIIKNDILSALENAKLWRRNFFLGE